MNTVVENTQVLKLRYLVFVNEHDYTEESEVFRLLIEDVTSLIKEPEKLIWNSYRAGCATHEIIFDLGKGSRFALYVSEIERIKVPRIGLQELEHGHIEMEFHDGTDTSYFVKKLCDCYRLTKLISDDFHCGFVFCKETLNCSPIG